MGSNNDNVDKGIGADPETKDDERTWIVIACFLAVALYNTVELTFIIFTTFKRRWGLYFWSFLVATWGIAPYAAGFILKFLARSDESILIVVLISVGWCCMVTGQSLVLYSRLHLLLWSPTRLRFVLCMIILDAFICHVPTIVLATGANIAGGGSSGEPFVRGYSVYEKVQVTIFFAQELVISGLYIYETVVLFRSGGSSATRRILAHLIYVNVIVIALDVAILALEYASLYYLQVTFKAFAYSVKLKLEFSILNRLVDLVLAPKKSSMNLSTRGDSAVRCPQVEFVTMGTGARTVTSENPIQGP